MNPFSAPNVDSQKGKATFRRCHSCKRVLGGLFSAMTSPHIVSQNRLAAGEDFWGEMAPCEHAVQIYGCETVFLDVLEGFVAGGLEAGDAVIVIATEAHRKALRSRLSARGISLAIVEALNTYIALDAEETLDKFMVDGWPDEALFDELVRALLTKSRMHGRKVRAFGEMVALMWARGMNGATVRLEFLWHSFCQKEELSLFCAYPRTGFTQDPDVSMREICEAHSLVIAG
jgi:hypothetical protein